MSYYERGMLVAVIIGALAGLTGVLVVLRQRVFFTQALTHATFPGAVIAAVLGLNVVIGAAAFGGILVLVMLGLSRVRRQGQQVAAGVVLTGGFALGSALTALTPQVPFNAGSFLIGSVFYVGEDAPAKAALVLVAVLAVMALTAKQLLFSTADPEGYRAAGYRSAPVELLVLALIVTTVVTALPVVGSILAIALLAGPAAAARLLCRDIRGMLWVSPLIGMAAGLGGVLASRGLGVSAGASIAVLSAVAYLLALAWSQWLRVRLRRSKAPARRADVTV